MVPFGLTNASTTFMCLMNNVFHPYLDKFVIVFVDDILVYSKNEEEHAEHLAARLRLLREHQLYGNLNKCNFFKSWIHYFGNVFFKERIVLEPKKIKAIMEWPALKNVDDIRSFMGLVSYYRRFIRNISNIGYHITYFQRKGKKFEWIVECVASFE